MKKLLAFLLSSYLTMQNVAYGQTEYNILDELDPRNPDIEKILEYYDAEYFKAIGELPFVGTGLIEKGDCHRSSCPVWLSVNKKTQKMQVYLNGVETHTWNVSTGKAGYATPDFDQNPNGRVYDRYSSQTYPGGDYNGLGNMPYAVFISGGYAIHGTIQNNWGQLGEVASKGCVRLHPDHALIFNRLVRSYGVGAVWITVE